jgi:hypothetical protein
MMTDAELKEFNEFVGANPIRNTFLPILWYILSVPHADLDINEYHKKDSLDSEHETSSITFIFKNAYGEEISGRIHYSTDFSPMTPVVVELWWGEGDCYCYLDDEGRNSKTVQEFMEAPTSSKVVNTTIGWIKKIAHDVSVNGHRPQIYFK